MLGKRGRRQGRPETRGEEMRRNGERRCNRGGMVEVIGEDVDVVGTGGAGAYMAGKDR